MEEEEAKILRGPLENLESYLEAIDQLRNNIRFFSSNKNFRSSDRVLNHANELLAKAISKLEEEFKKRLSSYSKPGRLFDCLSSSLRPSSGSPGHQGDKTGKNPLTNHHAEHHNSDIETVVYTPPKLIPPRALPLLHDLAQQMVQSGHQQQIIKIYRKELQWEEHLLPCRIIKLTKTKKCSQLV